MVYKKKRNYWLNKADNSVLNFISPKLRYYKDSKGNQYEKYNDKYFLFEDVVFVKLYRKNSWITRRVIDASAYNLYHNSNKSGNGKPENSIIKSMTENIGKVLGGEVFMPTHDDGEFGIMNGHSSFQKTFTDYAYEVLHQYQGEFAIYRSADMTPFLTSGISKLHYTYNSNNYWWLGTQYEDHDEAWSITPNGSLYPSYSIYWVMGLVVCIK